MNPMDVMTFCGVQGELVQVPRRDVHHAHELPPWASADDEGRICLLESTQCMQVLTPWGPALVILRDTGRRGPRTQPPPEWPEQP
jgi:hypothetical protein